MYCSVSSDLYKDETEKICWSNLGFYTAELSTYNEIEFLVEHLNKDSTRMTMYEGDDSQKFTNNNQDISYRMNTRLNIHRTQFLVAREKFVKAQIIKNCS